MNNIIEHKDYIIYKILSIKLKKLKHSMDGVEG